MTRLLDRNAILLTLDPARPDPFASPSCNWSTRTSPTNSMLFSKRPSSIGRLALGREFGTNRHTLPTRPGRLKTIAADLVRHFVARGFSGRAMCLGFDKATAVRMYDLVKEAWGDLAELRAEHDALPELECPWLASRIELMETIDMAVVASQSQNELKILETRASTFVPTGSG